MQIVARGEFQQARRQYPFRAIAMLGTLGGRHPRLTVGAHAFSDDELTDDPLAVRGDRITHRIRSTDLELNPVTDLQTGLLAHALHPADHLAREPFTPQRRRDHRIEGGEPRPVLLDDQRATGTPLDPDLVEIGRAHV